MDLLRSSTHILDSWTTCHSFVQRLYKNYTKSAPDHSLHIPPSEWSQDDYDTFCFLHRNISKDPSLYSTSTPGTALFQHWLSDFERISGDDYLTNTISSWNPWDDFPTSKVMKKYPDISDERDFTVFEGGREIHVRPIEYYTLWYTTTISSAIYGRANSDYRHRTRYQRCHLTINGANFYPVVLYEGVEMHPYSIFDDRNDDVDVGGMFIRRHYDLGVRTNDRDVQPPALEILVFPPPVVGKPRPSPASSNYHYTTDTDSGLNGETSITRDLKRFGTNESYLRSHQPMGQGGDHNLAQSGAVMQCSAGWDWIESTPDRNVGIWDKVEVEWIWGDIRLHDVRVQVRNVSVFNADDQESFQFEQSPEDLDEKVYPVGDNVSVSAHLDISVGVTRHGYMKNSDVKPIEGEFEYQIRRFIHPLLTEEQRLTLDKSTILASGIVHNVTIVKEVSSYYIGEVRLPGAKLWWPHTHGSQPLYLVTVAFRSYDLIIEEDGADNTESIPKLPVHEAKAETTFGIRTLSSYTHPRTKSFTLRVNGHSIFLVGGNWITTDQFLRFASVTERYWKEISLLKNAGFNSIRVWAGGISETNEFYLAADALGLLVYQEFWMTGDNNGRMAGSYDWPLDHTAYLLNAKDVIIRLRNHPSLILYGGGNELFPIPPESNRYSHNEAFNRLGTSPPRDIEDGLKKYIATFDGSRPYVSSSVSSVGDVFDPIRSLGPKDGPYGILNEVLFFDRNPGFSSPLIQDQEVRKTEVSFGTEKADGPGSNIGFQTEIGSVSNPELESLKRFLSPEALDLFPRCGETRELGSSIHPEWVYFKYLPFTEMLSPNNSEVDHICQFKYPPIENYTSTEFMDSIDDYTWSSQLAQYIQYKTLLEGYLHRMFEHHSAVFLWKLSSPSPTFRGALFDWYLATNGGYWGAHSALGSGKQIKLVLNLRDWSLHIVNILPSAVTAYSVQWKAYSFDSKLVGNGSIKVSDSFIDGNTVTHLRESIPWVGEKELSMIEGITVQNVLFYQIQMTYGKTESVWHHSDMITEMSSNFYFLTDPSETSQTIRKSRYSFLGALRKVLSRVKLSVSCHQKLKSFDISVECKLENSDTRVAIMTRLSLIRNPCHSRQCAIDDRILPTFFSNNYITLLPGSASHVDISTIDVDFICSNGYFTNLTVSIDGWNVAEEKIKIGCVS